MQGKRIETTDINIMKEKNKMVSESASESGINEELAETRERVTY